MFSLLVSSLFYVVHSSIDVSITGIEVVGEPDDGFLGGAEDIKISIQCGFNAPIATAEDTYYYFDEDGDSYYPYGYAVTCEVGDVLLFELNEIDSESRNEGGAVAVFYGDYAYLGQYAVNSMQIRIGMGDGSSTSVCSEVDVSVFGETQGKWGVCVDPGANEEGPLYIITASISGSPPETPSNTSSLSSGSCRKKVAAKAIILNGDPYGSWGSDDVTLTLECGWDSATSETKSLGTCELCRSDTFSPDVSVECSGSVQKVDVKLDINGYEFEECLSALCGHQTRITFYPESESTSECVSDNIGNPWVTGALKLTQSDLCHTVTVNTVIGQDSPVYTVILQHELLTQSDDCCEQSILCYTATISSAYTIQQNSVFISFLTCIVIVLKVVY